MSREAARTRCLVLVRAGAASLHGGFTHGRLPYDFALSAFADQPPDADGALFVDRVAGPKWTGLFSTITRHWDVVSQYDYIWLPDDDLRSTAESVSTLFERCAQYRLELAQPALTLDSHYSHLITLHHRQFALRLTNFVELMAPVCSRRQLERMLPTFRGAVSGWGLDFVWPQMATLPKVGIIDDARVTHTRPVGGPNYGAGAHLELNPLQELEAVAWTHGVHSYATLNVGGVAVDGRRIYLVDAAGSVESMLAALLRSLAGAPVTAAALVQYLAEHLVCATGEPMSAGPRAGTYIKAAVDAQLETFAHSVP